MPSKNKVEVKLRSGSLNIIASGMGMTFSETSDFEISLKFDESFCVLICLKFLDDNSTDKSSLRSETDFNHNKITISCINFNDFIGTGTLVPFNIATYDDKSVYFKFWVRTPEEKKTREIRYCFFMEGD